MAIDHRARKILARFKEKKGEDKFWYPLYELIGQYCYTRKQHFTSVGTPGEIQNAQVFDDTAVMAAPLMAAAIVGAMWPNGAKSFRIVMPFDMQDYIGRATGWQQKDTDEIKKFYEWQTRRMAYYMDNPKAGYQTALEEYMMDEVTFAIAGIHSEEQEDDEVPITYRAVDAKAITVDEGANGAVNCVYIERWWTVRQLVELYGIDNVSAVHKKEFESGTGKTKVQVVQVIEPRMDRDPYGFGSKNMPISSIHIDVKNEKILKESGYNEMPVPVCRFWKAMGEKRGRSPAMNALSAILEANVIGEAWSLFIEKTARPPLLVMGDAVMGNGIIDDSPGGVTVVSVDGRLTGSQKPIDVLYDQGDLQWTAARRAELAEIIKNHFFQDRLMDLNNEKRMTLGEANIRNELRGQTLNTVYTRQESERFIPDIERTHAILARRGLLGVVKGSDMDIRMQRQGIEPVYIPDLVVKWDRQGRKTYDIEFISPATRIKQAEELQGIEHTLQVIVEASGALPQVIDIPDLDFTMRRIQELTGAPSEMLNSMETVVKTRQAREEQQREAMELEAARSMSETGRNAGQAVASMAGAEQQGAA